MSLVSIITPTFNNQDTIEETWNSIKYQTYENWEWIVVNDGSSDNTKGILENLQSDKIRIVNLERNKGVSAARNAGLMSIRGEYVLFLDADDLLTKNSLNDRVQKFRNRPDLDFLDGTISTFYFNQSETKISFVPSLEGDVFKDLVGLGGRAFFNPSWLIRSDKLLGLKFNEGMTHAEDLLFFIELSKRGTYSFINEHVLCYRIRENSAMRNLKGIEGGYSLLKNELRRMPEATNLLHLFKKKSASIMFKSFLKRGEALSAIRAFWKLRF